MTEPRRTLQLSDTVLVVEHIRAFRVDPAYGKSADDEDAWVTTVWMHEVDLSFPIRGHHMEALTRAVEGQGR